MGRRMDGFGGVECHGACLVSLEPIWLDPEALDRLAPPSVVLAALSDALARPHGVDASVRWHYSGAGGTALVMVVDDPESDLALQKTLFVRPDNIRRALPGLSGHVALSELSTGRLLAMADGAWFTGMRTAAIAAYATQRLALNRARHLLVGAGYEAFFHARALADLGGMTHLTIWNRTPGKAQILADRLKDTDWMTGVTIRVAARLSDAVGHVDVVTTLTGSPEPLIVSGLGEDVLINAMGSYQPHAREIGGDVIAQARLVADSETAVREAGEFVLDGMEPTTGRIQFLWEPLLAPQHGVTLMKSVGAAFYDLALARRLWDLTRTR